MTSWIDIQKDPKHMAREKEKARELKHTQWWKNIIAKGTCHYCQKKTGPNELTMDHIVPLSRGGRSSKSNIVPACQECNRVKKYQTPVEMILDQMKRK